VIPASDTTSSGPGHDRQFTATHWSLVAQAGNDNTEVRATAMGKLYCAYWYPVYSFIRWRRRRGRHEAEDLAQAFFVHLVEAETVKNADREKGRFRTFLLFALEKFLVNDWKRQHRLKRGGQCQTISINEAEAAGCYKCEPVDADSPESIRPRIGGHSSAQSSGPTAQRLYRKRQSRVIRPIGVNTLGQRRDRLVRRDGNEIGQERARGQSSCASPQRRVSSNPPAGGCRYGLVLGKRSMIKSPRLFARSTANSFTGISCSNRSGLLDKSVAA